MESTPRCFPILCTLACWASIPVPVLREPAVRSEEVRLPITKDNSIVLVRREYDLNAGAKSRIRIKGNQHLVALEFDAVKLRGRTIESAVLVMRREKEV